MADEPPTVPGTPENLEPQQPEDYSEYPKEVNVEVLEKLSLAPDLIEEAQKVWDTWLGLYSSKHAAGEAFLTAVFDANPSIQAFFKSPKAMIGERLIGSLDSIIRHAGSRGRLLSLVQMLAFRHMDVEVNAQKFSNFRDAFLDLLEFDMDRTMLTPEGRYGLAVLMNYIGGALMVCRRDWQARVALIHSTWRVATTGVPREGAAVEESPERRRSSRERPRSTVKERPRTTVKEGRPSVKEGRPSIKEEQKEDESPPSHAANELQPSKFDEMDEVPTNFAEMFHFNVPAMGFAGRKPWMELVLEQLDALVTHVAHTARFREECEKLALALAQHEGVLVSEVRSVALSSLKSFVAVWDEEHEESWNWFWSNVEKMLAELDGLVAQEAELRSFLERPEEASKVVRAMHNKFFDLAPAGQDYFKESKTRMYHIAERTLELALGLYQAPKQTVEQVSSLGLRHVAYSIPVEFFPPFVEAAVQALQEVDESAVPSFRWAMALLGKILTRSVVEGSGLVMTAINMDSELHIRKAVSIVPRGRRAGELLYVTVGTEIVSPLLWAIDCGSLKAAEAILKDLLTIRANRHHYYFGADELFARHPDIVQRLIRTARSLLPKLLDGLVWRSRFAVDGQRRVNYYVKHLIVDQQGGFNHALSWVIQSRDTELVCHETIRLVADTIWSGLGCRLFASEQATCACLLVLFVVGQSFLQHFDQAEGGLRYVTFSIRAVIVIGTVPILLWELGTKLKANWREGKTKRVLGIRIPWLSRVQSYYQISLVLCLLFMALMEPVFWCIDSPDGLFAQDCPRARSLRGAYSVASMLSGFSFWLVLSNLSILSMRLSAFRLLCSHVAGELQLFMAGILFLISCFSSALATLDHDGAGFASMPRAAMSLWEILMGMPSHLQLDAMREDPLIFLLVGTFAGLSLIFLLSLLVAQLDQAYEVRYESMMGYAVRQRGDVIVLLMQKVREKRWQGFLELLHLDEPLEFNEGDVGLSGGLQVLEPAVAHPTAEETILRYGGSSSQEMPWPEEVLDVVDPLDELERRIVDVMKSGKRPRKNSKSKTSTLSKSTMNTSSVPTSSVMGSFD